ncbi:MAG: hypothetical protein H6745_16955 [Deltaproteobacteria bacterium]|nr:hypothetical protein [Deltaproteobacteria bacterium]
MSTHGAPSLLVEHLERARAARFVGRGPELAHVAAMLADPDPPRALYVYGPGGIGKTELLREAGRRARAAGRAVVELDVGALPRALADARPADWADALVIVDDVSDSETERRWLAGRLPTALPANVTLLMAGRTALGADWTADAGWSALLVQRALEPFDLSETRAFVARCGLADDGAGELHARTYGHPLVLALVVDAQQRGEAVEPLAAPGGPLDDGVLARIADTPPTAGHLAALRVAALARAVDAGLLAATSSGDDAAAHLAWLSGRPYARATADGLRLHDLVREAVVTALRARDEGEYWRLVEALLRAYIARGWPAADAFFALRQHPGFGPMRPWLAEELPLAPTPAPHLDAARRLLEARAGAEAARLFDHWLAGGASVVAVTSAGGAFRGFAASVDLARARPEDVARDPLTAHLAARLGPFASARPVLLWRFWACAEHDQAPGPVQARLFAHINDVVMRTPAVAMALHAFRDRSLADLAPMAGIARRPELDCAVAGVAHVLIGVDFRERDPAAWFLDLARRGAPAAAVEPRGAAALDRAAFDDAVRRALDRVAQPDLLAESPLLGARVVTARAGPDASEAERAAALAALLDEAIDRFRDSVRDDDALAVLEATFLGPRQKQDAVAASLGISPATYRRRLAAAVQRIKTALWEEELRS